VNRRVIPPLPSSSVEPSPRLGDVLFDRPSHDLPQIPDDLTDLGDTALMETFSRYVAWQNYAAYEFAQSEVEEARSEARVRFVEARAMVTNWDRTDKVTVARAELALDPEVERARQDLLISYAHRKMTGVIYANCERAAALVSRELTRRVGREPLDRRGDRLRP
jgi:hypothetical protein